MINKDFMKLTIASHSLKQMPLHEAAEYTPGFDNWRVHVGWEPSYFEAKRLASETSYFERMNILVSGDDFIYPPFESFTKSFEKWLAVQKHDISAVNSLYLWCESVKARNRELVDDMYELEKLAEIPALKGYVEATLARKEEEHRQLWQLRYDLEVAIDKVKSSTCTTKREVA